MSINDLGLLHHIRPHIYSPHPKAPHLHLMVHAHVQRACTSSVTAPSPCIVCMRIIQMLLFISAQSQLAHNQPLICASAHMHPPLYMRTYAHMHRPLCMCSLHAHLCIRIGGRSCGVTASSCDGGRADSAISPYSALPRNLASPSLTFSIQDLQGALHRLHTYF